MDTFPFPLIVMTSCIPLQSLPDKEGKKCLFYVKCSDKSFEISASDKKKKQEWIQGEILIIPMIHSIVAFTEKNRDCQLNVWSHWNYIVLFYDFNFFYLRVWLDCVLWCDIAKIYKKNLIYI